MTTLNTASTTSTPCSNNDIDIERLYYELCYRKAPRRIAWSTQNIIAWSPHPNNNLDTRSSRYYPNIGTYNPCRVLDGKGPAWSFVNKEHLSLFDRVENYHRFSDVITDLVWNQTGSALASIDQRGKIAIWTMNNFVNQWKCICNVNLGESVIEFTWLDSARSYSRELQSSGYGKSSASYKRGSFKGPRNQFGEFAFITITTDGKVSVWYQKGKKFFSKIITHLRYPSKRISHVDIVLNNDGNYTLATYCPEFLPKLVMFYEIKINMLSLQVSCRPIANVHLTNPTLSVERSPVLHLKLMSNTQSRGVRLIIVTAEKKGNNIFNSSIAMWEIDKITPPPLDPLTENAMELDMPLPSIQFVAGEHLDQKLVTNIWIQRDELSLGLSNGQVQFRNCNTLQVLSREQFGGNHFKDCNFPKYSTWVPLNCDHGEIPTRADAIIEFATSPNGTLFLCRRASGKLECFDLADSEFFPNIGLLDGICTASSCANKLTLSILNNIDHTDLENIIKKFANNLQERDLLEHTLKETFTNISSVFSDGLETAASSDFLSRLLGIQLSLLKSCQRDNINYLNTLYFLHLRALEAIFQNSVSSDGTFSPDSLKSLVSLASWVIDFSVYFVQNIHSLVTQVSKKSHIVLLYNSTSRTAFKNLLSLVGKFKEYVNSLAANSPQISSIQEMNGTLQYLFESWPLRLESLESFIRDTGIITDKVIDKWMKEMSNPQWAKYEIIFTSRVPKSLSGTIPELKEIFKKYFTSENDIKFYIYDTKWIYSESVDIILKSRTVKDRICARCGYYSAALDVQNTRWAKGYTRSCVCGGLWIDIKEK
ncbi:mediator of RNA polymerase II transcription subunit 16 [Rhizophagus clarus]|uniref:Mediator of RNA polymerase II transcription subunit 16 n=1 Tax=Rhizophagus clarus TaxID=94130 RepID=A0A8H3L6J8_9GLOM|nr:mediator of RNA polymerase II transcription subunit 16 [Rhizophagus clarus]